MSCMMLCGGPLNWVYIHLKSNHKIGSGVRGRRNLFYRDLNVLVLVTHLWNMV